MEPSSLAQKLQMRPGSRVLVVNAPEDYLAALSPLPEGAEVSEGEDATGQYDVVQTFVKDRLDVERYAALALGALRAGGVLWFSYPKQSSKVATDLTRDRGWDVVARAGLRPVAQVSVDDVWSAVRFRPEADVDPRR